MPGPKKQLKRYEHQGDVRYLTCSCYRRLPLFQNDAIKERFVEHLKISQIELEFDLYAWVLMPEHFHLLVRPATTEQTIEAILRRIKSGFAQRVIERWRGLEAEIPSRITDNKGSTHFWQAGGGYDRNIFTEAELLKKIAYIHLNPVKRGLVQYPTDWAWSSAKAYEKPNDYIGPPLTLASL